MGSQQTFYDVLGVGQQSTAEEVKAAYQKRALLLHPDKAGAESQDSFHLLQHAWQVLRDPVSRALYDHQLSQAELQATVVLHDEIELDEMEPCQEVCQGHNSTGSCQFTYPCRCGDSYMLAAADMQLAAGHSQQIIIPCRSCSNHILVKLPP